MLEDIYTNVRPYLSHPKWIYKLLKRACKVSNSPEDIIAILMSQYDVVEEKDKQTDIRITVNYIKKLLDSSTP